jgi:hypothetical protein
MEREGWELLRISAQRLLAGIKGLAPDERGVEVDPRELAVMLDSAREDVCALKGRALGLIDAVIAARAERDAAMHALSALTDEDPLTAVVSKLIK